LITRFAALIEYNKYMPLTPEQQTLLEYPIHSKIFLQGTAGSGKTTAAVHWLKKLLNAGIPANEVLVFVPQRTLAAPYQDSIQEEDIPVNDLVNIMTLGGLARRMVDLFWPMISRQTGVNSPNLPPHFLTLETAQYYMAHIIRPLIEKEGYFESLTINRNRIYSQVLDNLNKAAIVGFPIHEIGNRLKGAWVGDASQLRVYDDVQHCVDRFRAFCLENNLLDFSLQVETFTRYLWPSTLCRDYLTKTYRHLIADNIEEDTPISHDILREWLPEFESTLMVFDEDAGYRFFLGADVISGLSLRKSCDIHLRFEHNLISDTGITHLKQGITNTIARLNGNQPVGPNPSFDVIQSVLETPEGRPKYFPAMVQWVAEKVAGLIDQRTPPEEIVILAPFMPDVLQFSLSHQLNTLGIPNRTHRPSRALRDEAATQTLLTLARTAFPDWDLLPKPINLAYALMHAITGLDLVRAQLLTLHIYNETFEGFALKPFAQVPADLRERITYQVGERYNRLRTWLEGAKQEEMGHLDFFLNRLFGEVLSQPGFRFHDDLESGSTIANLVESIQKFRWVVGDPLSKDGMAVGREYVQMVQDGVIAAQYVHDWQRQEGKAVLLLPAYTFLISNQPVDIQFWLDIGSPSWYQRLDQPLTQPYVLNRNWQKGEVWDAEDELSASHDTLRRISLGLLNRCRKKLFIGMSELDIRGYENRGLLIRVFQHILQSAQRGTR
jgi:hypothetical protein